MSSIKQYKVSQIQVTVSGQIRPSSRTPFADTTLTIRKSTLYAGNWKFRLTNDGKDKTILEEPDRNGWMAVICGERAVQFHSKDMDNLQRIFKRLSELLIEKNSKRPGRKKKERNQYGKRKLDILANKILGDIEESDEERIEKHKQEEDMESSEEHWRKEKDSNDDVAADDIPKTLRGLYKSEIGLKSGGESEDTRKNKKKASMQNRKRLCRLITQESDNKSYMEKEVDQTPVSSDTSDKEQTSDFDVFRIKSEKESGSIVHVTDEEGSAHSLDVPTITPPSNGTITSFFQPLSSNTQSTPEKVLPVSRALEPYFWKKKNSRTSNSASIADKALNLPISKATPSPHRAFLTPKSNKQSHSILINDESPISAIEFPSPKKNIRISTSATHRNGLANLGNTCYLNASLQLLFSLPTFLPSLKLSTPLHSTLRIASQCANPVPFKAHVDTLTSAFSGYEQRDSHEFLTFLLDSLALSEFEVMMNVTLACESCGYKRQKQEMYRHLSLDIRGKSVEEGLAHFLGSEKRAINCEKCANGKSATQTMDMSKSPKALLLHLKRFIVDVNGKNTCFKKNQASVAFPQVLNFFPRPYKLQAVVHHIGNMAYCGHYTTDALVRSEVVSEEGNIQKSREEWVKFDDTKTRTLSWDEVGSDIDSRKNAYLLLYHLDEK